MDMSLFTIPTSAAVNTGSAGFGYGSSASQDNSNKMMKQSINGEGKGLEKSKLSSSSSTSNQQVFNENINFDLLPKNNSILGSFTHSRRYVYF